MAFLGNYYLRVISPSSLRLPLCLWSRFHHMLFNLYSGWKIMLTKVTLAYSPPGRRDCEPVSHAFPRRASRRQAGVGQLHTCQ